MNNVIIKNGFIPSFIRNRKAVQSLTTISSKPIQILTGIRRIRVTNYQPAVVCESRFLG